MFIPTTQEELQKLNWQDLDIILVTGDAYIDSPNIGISIIGHHLIENGYKVGIIAQPDILSSKDILRLGEPKLYWGVSAGAIDSMVANYTALKKKRKHDDMTPNEINNKRPDMATIVYTNLIKKYSQKNKPIVLGGIEASLRRFAHFDYIKEKIRHSILFDSQADFLVYGEGEKSIIELTKTIENGGDCSNIRGISYVTKKLSDYVLENYIELPTYDDVVQDKDKHERFFKEFYNNCDPILSKGLYQKQDRSRYVVQNPPQNYLTSEELDIVNSYSYERDVHPYYKKMGKVKAIETIKFSITTHRGCFGECNFCAIAVHQGATIRSRSENSIINEAKSFIKHKDFKGIISDVGGPTANMYKTECNKKVAVGKCLDKRCLYPTQCNLMPVNHKAQIELLKKLGRLDGIKKVFVASGIRYDMILSDKEYGKEYLKYIVKNSISGQMKIAPEHISDSILSLMGKPSNNRLVMFKKMFDEISNRKKFLTYYFIAAHPGSRVEDMIQLKRFVNKDLKINPKQVQIFTPTPSTYSTLMYCTQRDYKTKKEIFVEKKDKEKQKDVLFKKENYRKSSRKTKSKKR